MNYQIFSLIYGFTVWLVATLVFRFFGDAFFLIDQPAVLIALYAGAIPVLYFMVKWIFSMFKLNPSERLKSAILLALPGMICDVACIGFHDIVFPDFSIQQSIVLASWVLWAYTIVLLTGLQNSLNK